MTKLLEVHAICKYYQQKQGWLPGRRICALEPISFSLNKGETLAIMGETGSGKSTIAKLIAGADVPSNGEIWLHGKRLDPHNYRQRCRDIRMIFQDSMRSLNPQLTIGKQLSEALKFNTNWNLAQQTEHVLQTLSKVGLLPDHYHFYPHMLSTGQQQRVCIARAIILEPQIIVADEAFVALDPSIRAQIINLILDLQEDMGISFIFVSHSPEIVKHVADKILIMHRGKMIEFGTTEALIHNPQHQLTRMLLQSELLNKALKHTTTQE
ncbi:MULTISPECIES: ATP-binding cassette domain-containing protein [Idiomarinaceae]|uniref:Cationic peptide transport system ATP-binding protein n=4 Tax=Pseudidiomarina TaxID=2800384 RepID=A0A368V4J0_9GAMM|nr:MULTISPECIES: ATP-binding cassette domain-containing protein [Idiomarinaceae]MDT7524851.1 ATP-binding cassette domain-containing protein [Pseudidiomarina sp. GXY010]MDX1525165.1 ATP-binding cassette domain-containing protein [Pseudidiomarina maritima]MRJ40947.1 ATP-binding cassette domain-containing protein [Idiomarina sp. FeN1]NCU56751.1 ATP-binding cassette domain-containing protein [Idiomarina sp. FenA--70]NCU59131.1 ATP-binding cassette domain-containing protein [Idiomarina sp. FenBw--7